MLELVVLRARKPKELAKFYGEFGMSFVEEKHGNGPSHMACDTGSGVFEIYPYSKTAKSTRAVRLGFRVRELEKHCLAIDATGGKLLRPPHSTQWGRRATIKDPEGHLIDLVEG